MKPKKIVTVADDKKKFSQPGAIDVLRRIAEKLEWSLGFTVWAASEVVVKPTMPADVSAADLEAMTAEIVVCGKREKGEKEGGKANDGRLPFDDQMQEDWNADLYKGQVTIHGIRQRFVAEIKDGVRISRSMFKAYLAELATEKAKIAELVDERDDPDSGQVACEAPPHRSYGDVMKFQPTMAFRIERGADGVFVRRKHDQGDEFIVQGNFLVVKDEEGVGRAVPYCADCREVARQAARNAINEDGNPAPIKTTFYTFSGAQRVLDRMRDKKDTDTAMMLQLRSAGARTFGGSYGTRKVKTDWHQSRGNRRQ